MRERLRQVGRAGGFVGVTGLMLPAFLAHMKVTPESEHKDELRDRWVRTWAKALLGLFAVEVAASGLVPERTHRGGRGRVIVANHRSAIDIGVLLATFGGTMVSRADLARWPLVGPAARSVGTVFVERKQAESGAAVIRIVQRQLSEGRTILVFPEGTTFDGDEVRPFQRGAFVAAAGAGAEILPVGIAYPKRSSAAFVDESFPEHLARMARGPGTRMGLAIGTPFVPAPNERSLPLTRRAQDEVQALVHEARKLCGD